MIYWKFKYLRTQRALAVGVSAKIEAELEKKKKEAEIKEKRSLEKQKKAEIQREAKKLKMEYEAAKLAHEKYGVPMLSKFVEPTVESKTNSSDELEKNSKKGKK